MNHSTDRHMEKQQVVALVAAVAMLVAVLLDATFTFGELPAPHPAAQAPALANPDPAVQPLVPERVVAQAEIG